MAFYGFEHRYGANVRDESGHLMGTLYIFDDRASRDLWLAKGNDFQADRGARTPLKSRAAARWQRISAAVERA